MPDEEMTVLLLNDSVKKKKVLQRLFSSNIIFLIK